MAQDTPFKSLASDVLEALQPGKILGIQGDRCFYFHGKALSYAVLNNDMTSTLPLSQYTPKAGAGEKNDFPLRYAVLCGLSIEVNLTGYLPPGRAGRAHNGAKTRMRFPNPNAFK